MIIPALDLINGQVVRLRQGKYDQVTEYAVEPSEQFSEYYRAGAEWLHLVDLTGAKDPAARQLSVIGKVLADAPTNIQIGGGIRTDQDVNDLLAAGANRVVVGSTAIREPEKVMQWINDYGQESIVLAVDININGMGDRLVAISGWQEDSGMSVEALLDSYLPEGLKHVLCTDISRDGMLSGSNTALYRDLCRQFPTLAFQSSGGIGSLEDIAALKDTGVAGVIVGRALLDGRFSAQQAVNFWAH
ncbi:1-(5-phosphoribosyl)-5-[(5-phosphoribosylamino)methylideneamino]imidazole-4-carboxamide isomerase [Endozoicomonas sp.]|nr:1-(5-phosphoribosyl)-5-[(5-phosphoribosylamino)methylideneamino]imidazole-4-carboxamide isomerase [Endozoicomonas sp.]